MPKQEVILLCAPGLFPDRHAPFYPEFVEIPELSALNVTDIKTALLHRNADRKTDELQNRLAKNPHFIYVTMNDATPVKPAIVLDEQPKDRAAWIKFIADYQKQIRKLGFASRQYWAQQQPSLQP